jgi:peptide/nickel transport system substrate-binding protein
MRTAYPHLPMTNPVAPRRIALAMSVMLLTLAGCGDRDPDRQARRSGQVVVAVGADMDKPNPIIVATSLDSEISDLLYMRLLADRWEDGELVYQVADENPMALARSYEFFGPDSASIRYRLRSDVSWTDGVPITAHDGAFTLTARGSPEVASPIQDHNREIREIVVEDDSTLVIHFNRRYAEIFFHTAGPVIPRHQFEGSDLARIRSHPAMTDPARHLVTSGPVRIVEWVRGQRVVLGPNPGFEPQPTIERLIFRIVPEESTRMIELQTGAVDMAQVPFHYVDQIRAATHLRLEAQDLRGYEYIAYNPFAHDFFADPEIRRALGLALDRESLIAGLQLDEFAVPAGGPYAPIFRRLYDPEGQAPLPYDTAEARRIFTEKGWTRGRDGILQKDGRPLSFTLVTNAENQRRIDIAQIVERQWARVGVRANILTLEFNTLVERMTARNFEARIGGWLVGLSPDLYQVWGDPDSPSNYVSYDNPEVRRLMSLAMEQPTEEEAAAIWMEVAATIVADQPYTWLYYYDVPHGVNDRVQGTRIDTRGAYQEIWNWRVDGVGAD